MNEKLISVEEFAKRTGFNKSTIHDNIKSGYTKAVKIKTGFINIPQWRIPESEIDKIDEVLPPPIHVGVPCLYDM